jgi:DNA-directed RNA polymerase specialized sigma24 family protein
VTDDLVQDAIEEALTAFVRAPPTKDDVLVAWVATIARRVVADHLRKRGRRRKYEGSMPDSPNDCESSSEDAKRDSATEPSYDPSDDSVDDHDLRGRSLFLWLEWRVARNPIDRETFAILLEHGLGDKTYKTIAAERGIPLSVLSSRILEFRKKYVTRYKRERDRTVLLLLFFFGAAVVATLVWLFWRHDESPRETVPPSTPSILDRVLGHPFPGSRSRHEDALEPDAGTGRLPH